VIDHFSVALFADCDQPGGARVAVLSKELWQSRIGRSPQTLGGVIRLNEQPYTIIDIMPSDFEFPFTAASVGEPPALWVPIAFTAKRIQDRAAEFPVHIVARLKPGVSLVQAGQDAERVANDFQREHPDIYAGTIRLRVHVDPLGAEADHARPVLLALAGAVVFVLLIACANVTNLLLARAAVRQREMAVRSALGASAQQLIAQLVTEGLLLTIAGAAHYFDFLRARTSLARWDDFGTDAQRLGKFPMRWLRRGAAPEAQGQTALGG